MDLDQMMARMGFSPTDNGRYVTDLRKLVRRQISEGMINRSAGSWAPEHGLGGMRLPAEERARAFLEMEWELAQGHSYEVKCFDRPFGWRYHLKRDQWRYEIVFSKIPAWLGDRWRSFRMTLRARGSRLLGNRNPYARSAAPRG